MAGLAARLAQLWRPHPSINDGAAQRRAKLASGLLLVLLPLLLLAFLFPDETNGSFLSGHRLTLLAFVGLAASYGLVRNGRIVGGVTLAILTLEAALAVSVTNADDHTTAILVLGFFVVPVAMAGILLPVRGAAVVGGLTLLLAFALESIQEGEAVVSRPDQHAMTLALQLLAVSTLAVVSASMVEGQARDLEASRELLRQVTDNIPEVMFVVATDSSRTFYASPAYETVLGRKVEQAMADPRDWLKAVHPDDLPFVLKGLEANEPELQYRALHSSGAVKHIRARTFPIVDADGRVTRLVGLAEDVTAAVEAQQQLRDAQRQRIHLLQQLAHDLASPLSPVKIQLRLLKDRFGPDGEKALVIVQRNIEHVQRLVEDIKDVARLEGGGLKLDRKPADLVVLARQAVDTLGPAAAERKVNITLDAPATLPLNADSGRVTQVLYNLVGNALKFTPTHGHIVVELGVQGATAEVRVRDSGAGMRPDQLAQLFQPFVQVHDAAVIKRPEDKGTGLGLYISKGIVEAHGGTISAASQGPGTGSTFTFRLPLA